MKEGKHYLHRSLILIHHTDFQHFWQTKLPNNLINGIFIWFNFPPLQGHIEELSTKYNSRISYPAWHSSWQISPKVWQIISPFKTLNPMWLWTSLFLLLANILFKAWHRKTFSFPLETKYSSEKTADKMELCERTSSNKISHIAYAGHGAARARRPFLFLSSVTLWLKDYRTLQQRYLT